MIASATPQEQTTFLAGLSDTALRGLPYLWDFWALDHQRPPQGAWRNWVILGGRGAGKTRAGAEWVRAMVEGSKPLDKGRCSRVGLIGETIEQVREVMIFGESGITSCAPPDRQPEWSATRKMLTWPNGATAHVYSAHDPEALRGPQFDAAWVDELAKWKKAGTAWENIQLCLRIGDDPRVCVTTTPRNVGVLKEILSLSSTVMTHASTQANRAYLAESFLQEVEARFGGTRLGRQELEGLLLTDEEGALWSSAALDAGRVSQAPDLCRIVVGVDPSAGGADACGIVVAGVVAKGPVRDWHAYVLADETIEDASPNDWAKAVLAARHKYNADRVVVETNQGGAMVETILRTLDPLVPIRSVHASRGKVARAEPVAALYEQGRVSHVPGLAALEDEMVQMTTRGFTGTGSPDRVDALVWALHDVMIAPSASRPNPKVRIL